MKRRIALVLAISLLAATLPSSLAVADPTTPLGGWSTWWSNWMTMLVPWDVASDATPAGPDHAATASNSQPPVLEPTAAAVPDPGQTVTTTNDGEVYPEFDPNG